MVKLHTKLLNNIVNKPVGVTQERLGCSGEAQLSLA